MNQPTPLAREHHAATPQPSAPSTVAQVPRYNIDYVEPIEPRSFPNGPQGFNRVLPCTLPNIAHMMQQYGITARYDVIKKKLKITIPGHSGVVDNADNTAITTMVSLATLNGMQIGQVPALVEAIGDRHPWNPVADWITSKPWDGRDRLPELYATLTVCDDFPCPLKERLLYRWLLSATAASIMPRGFKARGVLTLQGAQGIGKTSWIMALVNDPVLRESVLKIDHQLDPGNKDSIIGAITHWIVELGELGSSLRKSDVSRLKGVLTSDSDKVRRPYARTEAEYQRRTVFCATVNDERFLVDHTGNTRWWTLPVVAINYKHQIDMQQVFAQLKLDVEAGEKWWLTEAEEVALELRNRDHRSVSLMRERLMRHLDLSAGSEVARIAMGTTEVLSKLGYLNPTNGDAKEVTGLLRELLGPSKKINGTQKWRVPWRPDVDAFGPGGGYAP